MRLDERPGPTMLGCFGAGRHRFSIPAAALAKGEWLPMLPNRIMIPHCSADAPTVDAFHCSNCEWTLSLPQPKPYLVAHNEAEYACRKFDGHRCEDFNQ